MTTESEWETAEEFAQRTAEETAAVKADALADRLKYDPDNTARTLYNNTGFWYPQAEEKRDHSGERG